MISIHKGRSESPFFNFFIQWLKQAHKKIPGTGSTGHNFLKLQKELLLFIQEPLVWVSSRLSEIFSSAILSGNLACWPADSKTLSFWIKRVLPLTATEYCTVCHDYGNIYLPQLLLISKKVQCWLISHTLLWSRQANSSSRETPELPFTPGPLRSIKFFNRDIEQPFTFPSWRDWYWWSSLYKLQFKIFSRNVPVLNS